MSQVRRVADASTATGAFVLSFIPGALAALLGVPVALWNLTDPTQRTQIGPWTHWLMCLLLAVVSVPFVIGVALPPVLRRRNVPWTVVLRATAKWVVIFGALAVLLAGCSTFGL